MSFALAFVRFLSACAASSVSVDGSFLYMFWVTGARTHSLLALGDYLYIRVVYRRRVMTDYLSVYLYLYLYLYLFAHGCCCCHDRARWLGVSDVLYLSRTPRSRWIGQASGLRARGVRMWTMVLRLVPHLGTPCVVF